MEEKSTGDLQRGILEQPDLDAYLKENRSCFFEERFVEMLAEIYGRRQISKAALARRAGMSEVYLHQVFSGRRMPSRDRLLCLCVGMEASLEETQQLLKRTAYAQLYPKIKRDAIIGHGLVHHVGLAAINDNLVEEGEKPLF